MIFSSYSRIRLAVIDGAGNTPHRRDQAGVSSGTWASGVVATALRSEANIEHCLHWANRVLFDRYQAEGRSQISASAVVVDIFDDRSLEMVRVGDCWMGIRDKQWEEVFLGDARSRESLEKFDSLIGWGSGDYYKQYALEQELFSQRDVWSSAPIGYFANPKLEIKRLSGSDWEQIMLGSDGTMPDNLDEMAQIALDPQKPFDRTGDKTLVIVEPLLED